MSVSFPGSAWIWRWFRHAVKREELAGGAFGIARDLRLAERQPVAQKQPYLDVAADKAEKGAKGRLRIVEGEQAGIAGGVEQRLELLADGEAAIGQHDG